jgi:hypothetical protein
MPSVPQLLKTITLIFDPAGDNEDFSLDVLDAEVVPTPGDIQTIRTLDGVSHSDAEGETWGLRIRAVHDWDTTRPGLAYYLFANRGEQVAIRFRKDTAAISTTNPEVQGTVTLVPISYGGNGNEYAESEVVLPFVTDPTLDTTP